MLASFGFKDGSGDWFITVDTEKCNGCAACVPVCPANVLEVGDDEYDPFRAEPVVKVRDQERNKVRYSCAGCRPGYGENPPPCVIACPTAAISHSDGWQLLYGKEQP